jgi:expansin (peptidoglycan-binding protein)
MSTNTGTNRHKRSSGIRLQYFNGKKWVNVGRPFVYEHIAWMTLGGDDKNYRTVDAQGNVLTDKREVKP